ncbi:MFS transporter [Aestuariivirga sp. YIM B02566]|uniref:MFS transporter n=1 Tax=Taklimakanibacter albus TaxID=2800327 RepID=A0ACC5RDR5_9HYPH|nr:MFS transporter [Aestuariivirga sp. YIM B02566]MBK1870636.1 MFS transporter [Aestuariivirga sp. YIM B02566]
MTPTSAPTRFFYGWAIVGAAFAVTLLGFGSAYTFSAFLTPLEQEFGASRGEVSLVFSLAGFLYFALGIISGPLADRYGARTMAVLGMLLVGAGLVFAGLARTIMEVYVAYGLGVGIGVGCAYVPAVGAVQRWFVRRRGFASGLAVSGIGLGTLVMPPLAAWLIDLIGWRHAYITLGLAAALLGIAMSWLLVNDPRDKGLGPDGDPLTAAAASSARSGSTVGEAVRSRQFIGLYAASLACAFGVFVPFVHLVPYALDLGIAPTSAVLLLGMIGVGSTAGRFFLGGLADRMGRHASLVAMHAGIALSLIIWALAGSFWTLALFAFLFGVFYGGWVAIIPSVATDYFGGRHIGGILGVLYTSVAFGTLIGPSAAGFAFDISHSYRVPILASIAVSFVAAALAFWVAKPARPQSQAS